MSSTTIQKCRASRYYSRISNSVLQDNRLTLKARGLIGYILSLPDNWTISIAHLSTISPDKEFSIRSAMDELKKFGYMSNEKIRDPAGRIVESRWTAYDDPDENPDLRKSLEINPRRGFPHVGNQGLQKKHTITTKETVGPKGPPEATELASEQPRCASLLPAGEMKGAKAPLEPAYAGSVSPIKKLKDEEASNRNSSNPLSRIEPEPKAKDSGTKAIPFRRPRRPSLARDLRDKLIALCDPQAFEKGENRWRLANWAVRAIKDEMDRPELTPPDLERIANGYHKLYPEAMITPAALAKWCCHAFKAGG